MVTKLDKSVNTPLKDFITSMPSFGCRSAECDGFIGTNEGEFNNNKRKKSDDIIDSLLSLDLSLF